MQSAWRRCHLANNLKEKERVEDGDVEDTCVIFPTAKPT